MRRKRSTEEEEEEEEESGCAMSPKSHTRSVWGVITDMCSLLYFSPFFGKGGTYQKEKKGQ
jgi:hypothetical protein